VTEEENVFHVVRGAATTVTVEAKDDGGEAALVYTWSANSGAGASFSENESNAAKSTAVSFDAPGDYELVVSVRDVQGLTAGSRINIRVVSTASELAIDPKVASLGVGETLRFDARVRNQFGEPMASQPASFTWSAAKGGTISGDGRFTATTAGGPFSIVAAGGGFTGSASVTVAASLAEVTLEALEHVYDGSPKAASVATDPPGLAVVVTYDGGNVAPTAAGSYAVEAAISGDAWIGSATGTMVIAKAPAAVTLGSLSAAHDGLPKAVTVTTDPPGLTVAILYDGSAAHPAAIGSYAVTVEISDPNYYGGASGTFEILAAREGFASWRLDQFPAELLASGAADALADPDGDGLANLAEYALGKDPLGADPPLAFEFGEDGLTLTFARPVSRPDISYGAETSGDATSWQSVELESLGVLDDRMMLRARVPRAPAGGAKLLRLRFSLVE
jgi:hypothetical protein